MTTVSHLGAAPVVLALYAETPLHPGTGQSTGVVDLPVQRERHTGFPIIPSTSLKGSLRSLAASGRAAVEPDAVEVLFGPPTRAGDDGLHAGALAFTDARLLAFPIRSLSSVFLWVTCPLVLSRLARDLQLAASPLPELALADELQPREGEAVVGGRSGTLVLEDLSLRASERAGWIGLAQRLATLLPEGEAHRPYREKFARDLVLVPDSDFSYLVQHATQITARIALNEHKLWYEETAPADTLFTALVLPERSRMPAHGRREAPAAVEVRQRFLELIAGDPFFIQLGGNETVGQGWCAVRVVDAEGGRHG